MFRFLPLWAALVFTEQPLVRDVGAITGWAADENAVAVWGERVTRVTLPRGKAEAIKASGGPFTEGGALFERGLVLNEASGRKALVYLHDGRREEIETGIETRDVIPARLFDRDGVLAIQKGIDLRFYWREEGAWRERVLYSIYTPSLQGGLALGDVDGDGLTDIYCGNYWLRSPAEFDLHWRLFAINVWSEQESSATMRLALTDKGEIAAQRDLNPARVASFTKPADPRQMWEEQRLTGSVAQPRGLAWGDFDGDGAQDVAVGEAAGDRRLLLYSRGQWTTVRQGEPILGLRAVKGGLLVITGRSVLMLRPDPLHRGYAGSRAALSDANASADAAP